MNDVSVNIVRWAPATSRSWSASRKRSSIKFVGLLILGSNLCGSGIHAVVTVHRTPLIAAVEAWCAWTHIGDGDSDSTSMSRELTSTLMTRVALL